MAIKVSLRQKSITQGRKSLYLDFYPAIVHPKTGELTRREFLKMYIYEKPKNPIQKQHNLDTLNIAEQIRQKRENILNKPEIYSEYEREQLRIKELGERDFLEYFRSLAAKREPSNQSNWNCALSYLTDFTSGTLKFKDLNEKLINDFKEYLLSATSKKSEKMRLTQNSALSYFNKVKATLNQAYKDGILQTDLNARISQIKAEETHRKYLSLEEANALVKAPCKSDVLKRARLFSILTGLRFSDIQKMEWREVEHIKGSGYYIIFKQQKTKGVEYKPISDQAYKLMGTPGNPTDLVFEGLRYAAYHAKDLAEWIKTAGITKKITFHCFRHTFATLQATEGTGIYTVSKMLGHRDMRTTQIYADIFDEQKRIAANKINLDL